MQDEHSAELRDWVDTIWPDLKLNDFILRPEFHAPDDRAPQWQALHGDAGFRRYFRLASEPSLLAVYAPPESENIQAFLEIGGLLRKGGVLAPAVAACEPKRGYLLIEDFGASLYLDVMNSFNADSLYRQAMEALAHIQLCPKDTRILGEYSRSKLREEMNLFPRWFVGDLLGYSLSIAEERRLDEAFTALEDNALAQPQVVVHRDYHSRNLIYRPEDAPGVIDFQDAVIGPITYDLVSLLRDCYIRWPDEKVKDWALNYCQMARSLGICDEVDVETFLRWFDLMGLQRHIKVLGIFARLSLRDAKHGYLNDLTRVYRYTIEVAKAHEETLALAQWMEEQLFPLIQEQPWYDASCQ